MRRTVMLLLAGLLAGGIAHAQTSAGVQAGDSSSASARAQRSGAKTVTNGSASNSANASAKTGQNTAMLSEGTMIHSRLVGSLDAKKSKPGDRVEARTTQDVKQGGKVVLRRGTRLIGRVTRVQARSKGQSRSVLGVAFDHAQMRNGEQMPIRLAVQALATTQAAEEGSMGSAGVMGMGSTAAMGSGAAGGGLVGGTLGAATGVAGGVAGGAGNVGGTALGSTVGSTMHSRGAVGGLDAGGVLRANSRGIFGLQGVSLESSGSGAAHESTLVSSRRNVHLDSGTQMLLRVEGQSQ
jgi:hypothetical protein